MVNLKSKKIVTLLLIIQLIIIFLPNANSEGLYTQEKWSMFHKDLQHSGNSTSIAPDTNNVLWDYETDSSIRWSSPAIVENKVYIGSYDKKVYCLDAVTGVKVWEFETDGYIWSSPAVEENKVYIGSYDKKVYCLDAVTGVKVWEFETGGSIRSSPAVYDDKVYIGSNDGKVYCIYASNGTQKWSFTNSHGWDLSSSPAIVDGKVYVGSYCLDAQTGTELWSFQIIGEYYSVIVTGSSPAVIDDRVYLGVSPSYGGNPSYLCCFDANPTDDSEDEGYDDIDGVNYDLIWMFETNGVSETSSPAVANGKVYFGSWDNKIYCLDAQGNDDGTTTELWNYSLNVPIYSSPSVSDGKVYIGSNTPDNKIYCLEAENGDLIWSYLTGGSVESSPSVYNGRLFVGSMDGFVYCFGNNPPETPSQPDGLTVGEVGDIITFSTSTNDPEGHQIQYGWDWDGDDIVDEWTNLYDSGVTLETSHRWISSGNYDIKVKAKDSSNAE
ncbi:MAG: hypothetical protein DRN27_09775, partial [Thermoplasmata archaeon]